MTMKPEEIARLEERKAIVKWMRGREAFWYRMARKSEARGPEYADIARSQALMAASYSDHAESIESGEHLRAALEKMEGGR